MFVLMVLMFLFNAIVGSELIYNMRSVKKNTKRSSNTILHLVSFFMEQALSEIISLNIKLTLL